MASTKNLNEGRAEVIRALFSSLSLSGAQPQQDGASKLNPNQVEELSKKLEEILGDRGDKGPQERDKDGQLLNAEGLPIVEVTEPVGEVIPTPHTARVVHDLSSGPPPLDSLTPAQRQQNRKRWEHILDVLEAEEELEKSKSLETEKQKAKAELDRRRREAEAEVQRLKDSKEIQRKMANALVTSIRARSASVGGPLSPLSPNFSPVEDPSSPKKSVSFAGVPLPPTVPVLADAGDVSLPTRPSPRKKLFYKSELNQLPLKMKVVERQPGKKSGPPAQDRDSDDESGPENQGAENDDVSDEPVEADADADSSSGEEYDMSQAQRQREVELEYNRLRDKVGHDVARAMASQTLDQEADPWDKPEVPLEASLASKPPKSNVSRFKASRQKFPLNSPTPRVSLSIPAIPSHALQHTIRMGKVEGGQLISQDDSDDEKDGGDGNRERETLEVLKTTPVIPVGPTFSETAREDEDRSRRHAVPPSKATIRNQSPSSPAKKTNAFHGNSERRPILSSVMERNPRAGGSELSKDTGSSASTRPSQVPFKKPPTVISAPPRQRTTQEPIAKLPYTQMTVIDSPSFPPPTTRKGGPPAVMSDAVVEKFRGKTEEAVTPELPRQKSSRFKSERQLV